jgi:hypothetical protein
MKETHTKPTAEAIYRSSEGALSTKKGPGATRLHPDDCLEYQTTLHTFPSAKRAQAFIENLDPETGNSPVEKLANQKRWAVITQSGDKPPETREILEINH